MPLTPAVSPQAKSREEIYSNALEKRKALAGSKPFVIDPLQFGDPPVSGACRFGELGRLVEAVHNSVITDRDMGVCVFNDLNRVARGEQQQPGKENRSAGRPCEQPRPVSMALLPRAHMQYILFMIYNDHDLSPSDALELFGCQFLAIFPPPTRRRHRAKS